MEPRPAFTNVSRRNLLKFGVGAIGTGTFTAWLGSEAFAKKIQGSQPAPQGANPPQTVAAHPAGVRKSVLTPDQALQELMAGNDRFVAAKRKNLHQDMVRVTEVAKGQAPFAAILSCADSRVVPEIAFDQGIGDIFVVRVAGNIATIEDIASEEYGVAVLGAPLLLVLGHERCGAVHAALDGGTVPGVIGSLVTAIRPAVEATKGQPGDHLTNAIKANVRIQVSRLQSSSVIADLMSQGKLKVVGGYYDLDTGKVELLT